MNHRHHIARLSLALAAACAFSATAYAQSATEVPQADKQAKTHHMHKHGHHHGHRFGQRGGIENMRGLNLTEAQRDKIFEIRHAAAPETREVMKEVAEARKALRELSRAETFDEAKAKDAADKQGAAIAKIALLRANTQNQIHAVLTPEQRQQIQQRRDRRANKQTQAETPKTAS